jgi:hypothetical protein
MTVQTITDNPWFSLAGPVVAIASLIVAFIFYRKSRRYKTPCYHVTRQSVIENSVPLLPGLSIQFNGVVQEVITVAKVAFWNDGAETIARQDIAEAMPLAIVVDEGGEVLNTTVIKSSDLANQFEIGEPTKQENGHTSIPISFDFLDRGNGALAQVVHNGVETTQVWVEGRIKGANVTLVQSSSPVKQRMRMMLSSVPLSHIRKLVPVIISIYSICGVISLVIGVSSSKLRPAIILGLAFLVSALLFYVVFLFGRKVPAAIDPIDV